MTRSRRSASRGVPARRFPWYLITGLVIGIAIGIIVAWLVFPVRYVDTEPATLRDDFKEQYRALIAAAYAASGDLARAQERLSLLRDSDIGNTLAAQAQRELASGAAAEEVRALAQLAAVADAPPASVPTAVPLTQFPTPTESSSQTPLPPPTGTLTETPIPTLTSLPTNTTSPFTGTIPITDTQSIGTQTLTPLTNLLTQTPTGTASPPPALAPTATSASPYILEQRTLLCEPDLAGPLLIVQTLNQDEFGIPGVEIILNWPNGEEHFFTGLKPELGQGYADFAMAPDLTYTLRLADGSQLIPDLAATQCQADDGQTIWGSWELIFIQP